MIRAGVFSEKLKGNEGRGIFFAIAEKYGKKKQNEKENPVNAG